LKKPTKAMFKLLSSLSIKHKELEEESHLEGVPWSHTDTILNVSKSKSVGEAAEKLRIPEWILSAGQIFRELIDCPEKKSKFSYNFVRILSKTEDTEGFFLGEWARKITSETSSVINQNTLTSDEAFYKIIWDFDTYSRDGHAGNPDSVRKLKRGVKRYQNYKLKVGGQTPSRFIPYILESKDEGALMVLNAGTFLDGEATSDHNYAALKRFIISSSRAKGLVSNFCFSGFDAMKYSSLIPSYGQLEIDTQEAIQEAIFENSEDFVDLVAECWCCSVYEE